MTKKRPNSAENTQKKKTVPTRNYLELLRRNIENNKLGEVRNLAAVQRVSLLGKTDGRPSGVPLDAYHVVKSATGHKISPRLIDFSVGAKGPNKNEARIPPRPKPNPKPRNPKSVKKGDSITNNKRGGDWN